MPLAPQTRYKLPGQNLYAPVLDRSDFSGMNDDSAPDFDADNQFQTAALPDPEPMPAPPNTTATGPARQVATAPPPAPSADPSAYKELKAIPPPTTATGAQTPPPPPIAAAPAVQTTPPPPAPLDADAVGSALPGGPPPPPPSAMDRLKALTPPAAPGSDGTKPSWARRLLAGLAEVPLTIGEMRGSVKPETAQALEQNILYPGYAKQRRAFETQRADIENQQNQELKQEQIEAQAAYKRMMGSAAEERSANTGLLNDQRAQANKDRIQQQQRESNRKFLEDRLKGREGDAVYQQETDQRPPGWEFIADPERPGAGFAVPPSWMKVTDQMKIPGRQAGDMVPWSEFKTWQKSQDTAAAKPPKPATTAAEVLLNPGQYTADQVAEAKRQFGAEHRPPQSENPDIVAARDRLAQALAAGDLTRIKDVTSMRNDERMLLFDRVKQINPQFNTAEIDRKIKMEDYYQNGKGANNLQSFGTFLEHAGAANDAADQMWNTSSRVINKPLNWWRANMSGDPNYINLVGALEPVRKEFEGFLLGGRALYGDDRRQAEILLNDNSSPQQIQNALKRMGHTAAARLNEENFRYRKAMGKDLTDPVSPEALEGARKIGVQLGGGSAAPAAGTPRPTVVQTPQGTIDLSKFHR